MNRKGCPLAQPSIPVAMKSGAMTKQERAAREAAEAEWRRGALADYEPIGLTESGMLIFAELAEAIPESVLCKVDGFTVEAAADAIDKLRECRAVLARDGLLVEYTNKAGATNTDQNKAALLYQKFSDIAAKRLADLGLTPTARAKVAQEAAAKAAQKGKTVFDVFGDDEE